MNAYWIREVSVKNESDGVEVRNKPSKRKIELVFLN